ncbi:glycoprotein 3-alpha-L-fucosyltransferase A-like [Limulus polyphemus]|uniref:Fucosyltransferase n=1 Tax=Limulus polyphemus TaxID=6850 RepID=A0ABM1B3E8_LIMPO|nr:glycoprotein 3-alpha-L-fucosyltransferase A-like [Limulus polyphemus]
MRALAHNYLFIFGLSLLVLFSIYVFNRSVKDNRINLLTTSFKSTDQNFSVNSYGKPKKVLQVASPFREPVTNRSYVILIWISEKELVATFRSALKLDNFYMKGQFKNCNFNNCIITENISRIHVSDALLIPYPELQTLPKITQRPIGQIWVFWAKDGPFNPRQHLEWKSKRIISFFNWTVTYRKQSDIVYQGYGYAKKKANLNGPPRQNEINFAIRKTRLVVWLVSNCQTKSRREKYVELLQKYLPVDIVGKCNYSNTHISECSTNFGPKCFNWISKQYKFLLSFETKICKQYITDMFFYALKQNIVPVLMSGKPELFELPPKSFINIRDYQTPAKLARYLLLLDKNDYLYNQYFKWIDYYNIIGPTIQEHNYMCELCKRLNRQNIFRKMYFDLKRWWESNSCENPWW